MWLSLSILSEYVAIVDGVADRLWQDPSIDPKTAMWLATGLHLAQYHTAGVSASRAPMLLRALELAELHGDFACQLACLWGVFRTRMTEARYGESLAFAQRFADLTPHMADFDQRAVGQRIVGLAKWRNGDFAGARQHSDIALASGVPIASSFFKQLLIYKQGVAARANASNLLWLTGFADQAVVLAEDAVAMGLDHDVLGLCYGLAQAIVPLAFWTGELDQAHAHTMLLIDLASDNGLGFWLDWGGHTNARYIGLLRSPSVARTSSTVTWRLSAGCTNRYLRPSSATRPDWWRAPNSRKRIGVQPSYCGSRR